MAEGAKINIELSLADMKKQLDKMEKEIDSSTKKTAKKTEDNFKKVEKTISQSVRGDAAFKKRMDQIETGFKKELSAAKGNNKKREAIVKRYYKTVDRMAKMHADKQTDLTQRAMKMQEIIVQKSAKKRQGIWARLRGKQAAGAGAGVEAGTGVGKIGSDIKGMIGIGAGIAGVTMGVRALNNALGKTAEIFRVVNEKMVLIKTLLSPEEYKFLPEIWISILSR